MGAGIFAWERKRKYQLIITVWEDKVKMVDPNNSLQCRGGEGVRVGTRS